MRLFSLAGARCGGWKRPEVVLHHCDEKPVFELLPQLSRERRRACFCGASTGSGPPFSANHWVNYVVLYTPQSVVRDTDFVSLFKNIINVTGEAHARRALLGLSVCRPIHPIPLILSQCNVKLFTKPSLLSETC
jgi:hypothetical protein